MTSGSRNLLILGAGAIIIAGVTTSISLAAYRVSGDIYLDRSRPGYLPDEEEVSEDAPENPDFVFSDSGALTTEELGDYLDALKAVEDRLDNYPDAFSPTPLSDASLGIPSEFTENPDEPLQIKPNQ